MKARNSALLAGAAALGAGALVKYLWKQKYREENKLVKQNEKKYWLYYHWILLKHHRVGLDQYFQNREIHSVAVMDLSPQGRQLISEIEGTNVTVSYAIEKENLAAVHETLQVLRLHEDALPKVDAVVLCSLNDVKRVSEEVTREVNAECKVIALETVILDSLKDNHLGFQDGVLRSSPYSGE
ncbi:MAG: hypothetical protein LKJ17_04925 [Oscillospiraceae bacterium]|jgi:hypothetical protein|nr:hypothetical protein [Oscillospiraceae bacterium]